MALILYHGSTEIIRQPEFGKGKPYNDYGLGFYCTQSLDLAKEWACGNGGDGYANCYSFDHTGLKVLNLADGSYNILNWLAILLNNRIFSLTGDVSVQGRDYILQNFLPAYEDTDVLIGYRADDSYFSFANSFLNNAISLRKLERAMVLGELGLQVVPRSEAAFSRLHFVDAIFAEGSTYYPKRKEREESARSAFRKMRTSRSIEYEVFLIDIIRERWGRDDDRLQRVTIE